MKKNKKESYNLFHLFLNKIKLFILSIWSHIKLRKKMYLMSSIMFIVFLIIIGTIFYFTIRINLYLSDEILITHDPTHLVLNKKNKDFINFNFTIKIENSAQCKSVCDFNLQDLYDDSIIYSKKEEFSGKYTQTYNLQLNDSFLGSGQKMYLFETKCRNKQEFFCPTDSKIRSQSSLIILNYELTNPEKEIIENKFYYEYIYNNLIRTSNKNIFNLQKISKLPPTNEFLNFKIKINNTLFIEESNLNSIQDEINLWNTEKYEQFKNTFNINESELDWVLENSKNNDEQLNKSINYYNLNINEIKKVAQSSILFEEILKHYSKHYTNESLQDYGLFKNNLKDLYKTSKNIEDNKINNSQKLNEIINITKYNLNSFVLEYNYYLNNSLFFLENIKTNYKTITSNSSDICININERMKQIETLNETNKSINNLQWIKLQDKFCGQGIIDNVQEFGEIIESIEQFNVHTIYLNNSFISKENISLIQKPKQCCIFGECRPCCEEEDCSKIPVIFVHGYSFYEKSSPDVSLNSFVKLQRKLGEENFIDGGSLDLTIFSEEEDSQFGKSNYPITFRSSYYYITSFELGKYSIFVRKTDRIENYAIRLNEIIEGVKFLTNSKQVDVVSFSMGGLVVREYINIFGGTSLNKVITINTPHKGISDSVVKYCTLFGNKNECEDLSEGSIFLNRLNNKKIPENVEFHAIRSVGCKMGDTTGDGIVKNESGYFEQAQNYEIKGICSDSFGIGLHTDILDIDKYPKLYEIILGILK